MCFIFSPGPASDHDNASVKGGPFMAKVSIPGTGVTARLGPT